MARSGPGPREMLRSRPPEERRPGGEPGKSAIPGWGSTRETGAPHP
jgi:hypothetical protein